MIHESFDPPKGSTAEDMTKRLVDVLIEAGFECFTAGGGIVLSETRDDLVYTYDIDIYGPTVSNDVFNLTEFLNIKENATAIYHIRRDLAEWAKEQKYKLGKVQRWDFRVQVTEFFVSIQLFEKNSEHMIASGVGKTLEEACDKMREVLPEILEIWLGEPTEFPVDWQSRDKELHRIRHEHERLVRDR